MTIKTMWIDKSEMPHLWEVMWSELASVEGGYDCENHGEVWQYMGSKIEGERLTHTFRHRYHPRSLKREYRNIFTTFTGEVVE